MPAVRSEGFIVHDVREYMDNSLLFLYLGHALSLLQMLDFSDNTAVYSLGRPLSRKIYSTIFAFSCKKIASGETYKVE